MSANFEKGQRVEMTTIGLHKIRLDKSEQVKKHRHGVLMASTGVVITIARNRSQVCVRLDSMPQSSTGVYYSSEYWKPITDQNRQCYVCDLRCPPPGVFRVPSRGPRQGQSIGPLCKSCEEYMDSLCLLRIEQLQ